MSYQLIKGRQTLLSFSIKVFECQQNADDAPALSRHPDSAKNPTNIANSFNAVKQIASLKYSITVE